MNTIIRIPARFTALRRDVPENAVYAGRAVKYRDAAYTVAALVTVPTALGYRYYGSDAFVLNAQTFIRDTGTDSVMYYAFDMTDEAADASMEAFLQDYTENTAPWLDYESKGIYAAEFDGFREHVPASGRSAELHRGTGWRAEFFQRHSHRDYGKAQGAGRAPVPSA